jgi:formylglycine-generating enzyme required for sulfatase activity
MMTDPSDIQQKIDHLESQRALLGDAAVDAAIAALKAQQQAPQGDQFNAQGAQGPINKPEGTVSQHFGDDVGDKISGTASTGGDNYGQNIGQMSGGSVLYLATIIRGSDPDEDYQRNLKHYLEQFSRSLNHVPLLNALAPRLARRDHKVGLPDVYTMLATQQFEILAQGTERNGWSAYYKNNELIEAHHPDYALPHQAIMAKHDHEAARSEGTDTGWKLWRARLATEAVVQHRRLVLLGDPGGGKSTFLRYLAWAMARHTLGQQMSEIALPPLLHHKLPGILPLRSLASLLVQADNELAAVKQGLVQEMQSSYAGMVCVEELLGAALDQGAVALFFDGLDEVPVKGSKDRASREATFAAVRNVAEQYDVPTVVTCRVRAYEPFQEMGIAGWVDERLAPFTFGQIQYFVRAWYGELAAKAPEMVTPSQAEGYTDDLLKALRSPTQKRLRTIVRNPLLLTMTAWVLCDEGELPRDRPTLYERILQQLLWQWDNLRQHEDLVTYARLVDMKSDDIRPIFDKLAYQAHQDAPAEEECGRLAEPDIRRELECYFVQAGVPKDEAASIAVRCVEYFDFRSGLLLPDGQQRDVYVFAHRTLQEHCAGRHIVFGNDDPVALVMEHRADDLWREPIFLGLGLAPPADLDDVFDELLKRGDKPRERWYRDLILAAELGEDRKWSSLQRLPRFKAREHKEGLRTGLAALLNDATQPIPVTERLRAGALFADLGDPRFPVRLEEWQQETARRNEQFGKPDGYWRYVPAGTYRIGGWKEGEASADHDLPGFWIARYPITVAQYRQFIEAGGYDKQDYWTPNGWKWRRYRTQPYLWGVAQYNSPNQAVIGVTWYEAVAFMRWLNQQLAEVLPAGWVARLPTEAEWEAAAAYDGPGTQQRLYPWGNEPAPDTERAIFDESGLNVPAPVGVCAAGAAACGALDMVGNVWEAATSSYGGYPGASGKVVGDFKEDDFDVPWRGASWWNGRTHVRCAARNWDFPDYGGVNGNLGFRVLLSPRVLPN